MKSLLIRTFPFRQNTPLIQHSTTYKINANGGNIRLGVRVVGESEQQTRLSDTGISNEQEFKEIIAAKNRNMKIQ